MQIVLGRKYKVDKQKLQMLCVKYNWVYKECCDYVTPVCVSKYVSQRFNSITFSIKENEYYFFLTEECLIDEREEKLKKILCK